MKVVHLCTFESGGAGKAAYRLNCGLRNIGVNSSFLVANRCSNNPAVFSIPFPQSASVAGTFQYSSNLWGTLSERWNLSLAQYPTRPEGLEIFTDTFSLYKFSHIREIADADIINFHWMPGLLNYEELPTIFRGKKLYWTIHDMNPFTGGCHYTGTCTRYKKSCGSCPQLGSDNEQDLSRAIWQQKFKAYRDLDITIISPSKWLSECSRTSSLFCQYEHVVIPNSVSLDVFKPSNRADVRAGLNITQQAKVVLFGADDVSNTRKGFKYLLSALHEMNVRGKVDTIILAVIGNCTALSEIPCEYQILNFGHIADESQLALIYNAADVFALPSLEDNLPNTVVESLACGTPVAAFAVGGVSDMVEHGKCGYLAPVRDVVELARGIEWCLTYEQPFEMRQLCRTKAEYSFGLERQANEYNLLYSRQNSSSSFGKVPKTIIALPKIVIVTPSYNQADYLDECIDSILSQNYPNLEYIIMDGGSTDGSVEIIKKYEKHLTYWQSQKDGGQYQAINEGFLRSTGEIMTWLNSDDKYHPGALHQVALAFRAMPQAKWITGRPTAWNAQGQLVTVFDHVPSWTPERLLYPGENDYYIQQESTFWRRSLWDKAGGRLDANWQLAADFELWCRFFRYSHIFGVDALLGGFRYHSAQKTASLMNSYEQEVLQIIDMERGAIGQGRALYQPTPTISMDEVIMATAPELSPEAFSYFSYSRRPHFSWFDSSAIKLFGSSIDPEYCDLKMYQDLLCYTFITDNIPKGSRILEIGGGDSRILKAIRNDYECWNIDKLEGLGNGLTDVTNIGYRLVRAYMGEFCEELPEDYFDFVLSISALEHTAESDENFRNICQDIDRIMKPGSYSLHCFDVVTKRETTWTNLLLPYMFRRYETINPYISFEQMRLDPSLYVMSEHAYNHGWRQMTKQQYQDFGKPLSYNILWHKPNEPISDNSVPQDPLKKTTVNIAKAHDQEPVDRAENAQVLTEIIVATSIAPKNIDRQKEAIASWLHHGFKVISVNTAQEIAILKPDFSGVAFVETQDNAQKTMGRPLIFLDDVLIALKSLPSTVCGIMNSDIHLRNDISIYDFVASEAKGSFICGHRYDVENLSTIPGKLYLNGFDLFFFDTSVLDSLPPSPFCIGATWWDIWVPLAMILKNVTAKRIIAPLGFHVLHTNKWDEQEWLRNSIRLVNLIDSNQFDLSRYPGFSSRITTLYDQCMPQGLYKLFRDFILAHTQLVAPEQMLPGGIDPILQEPSYLVSAIVSTYNAGKFFSDCMNNLISQTLYEKGQLEIIIINSGSEEDEARIAQRFMESHDHMVYQRTERETLYAAWNRGIKLARGKYITHANTDDRHQPNAFERMAHILDQHDVGLVYVDALMTTTANENFAFHSAGRTWLLPDFNIRQALLDCPFGCQVMWRASVHENAGMFDASYKRAGDYEFFLRVGLKAGAMHLPEVLALYHESPNNLSYQSPQEVIQEVNRFIGDYRRQLPLEIIYPYLKHDSSPLAKAAALVDFANNLMGISGFLFSDTQLADVLYRQALEILPHDSDILGNLVIACIVNGNAFEAHSLVKSVINPSPRLTYYKELLAEGKSPEFSLTHVEYPGLNAMQAVKTASEIRVPWERPVMDSSVKTIIIDGVIFQLQHGRPFGISRMWLSLLTELGKGALASRIILLDRVGTVPKIPGIQTRRVPVFNYGDAQMESVALDDICREENAELFLSTYYTYTNVTPSLLMLYDMIPERFEKVGPVDAPPAWRDKYHAIVNSSAFAVISQSTARDLVTFYPQTAQQSLTVIHCAVSDDFKVHSEAEIAEFKAVNGIDRPYFLLVGRRDPHKNVALFFQAFARLPDREQYAIFMAGGGNALEPELRELAGPATGYGGFFSDQDLSLAYSGAIALVYPSVYEGFGLPILEAMQSGCPVITCQNSSLPEVAGSAALYVGEGDYEEMARTLVSVQQPDVRSYLIKRGLERSRLFSWRKSEELLEAAILKTVAASGEMQISRGK